MDRIYLDHAATTPPATEVLDAMLPALRDVGGNPSSVHAVGRAAAERVERARAAVARLLGCAPREIIFTSGGTEADNLAIFGAAYAREATGKHLITSAVEHHAVLRGVEALAKRGWAVTILPVDRTGLVDPAAVAAAIRPDTALVTIMHANNEVGTIQPIEEIAAMARSRGILMHTDAAQSPGKVPVDVRTLGVDLLTVAGHKLYAPKGVGALYIREGVRIDPFMNGAGQERGQRAGTENVIGIVGLGMACEVAARDLRTAGEHLRKMRDLLHEGIVREIPDARLNGHPLKRLPNTLSLSFRGLDAGRILEEIGLDVAASAGAACHSEGVEISHVLAAMAVPEEWASGTLRLSTGRMTAEEEIRRAVRAITDAFRTLRAGK